MTPRWLGGLAASYLIGSIPTGYWLGKLWKGIDIRQRGSGNLGATNVFRVLGRTAGILTLAMDIFKGALPVLWAQAFAPDETGLALAMGLATILGHTKSIFVRFQGGKGVATSAGVFAALLPIPFMVAILLFGGLLAATRIVSLASMAGALGLALAALLGSAQWPATLAAVAVALYIIWNHRSNIRRLANGAEPRIGSGPSS